jgi:hypothetical protein
MRDQQQVEVRIGFKPGSRSGVHRQQLAAGSHVETV